MPATETVYGDLGLEAYVTATANQPGKGDARVVLAAERTLLAWVRTGLAMMGFGFVVARFGLFLRELAAARGVEPLRHVGMSQYVGIVLVLLGIAVHVLAAVQHVGFVRRFNRGEELNARHASAGVALSAVLALLGLALAGYLIWL